MVFSRFSQGYNSSNGFLDQTWRVYKSKTLTCILITFDNFLEFHKQLFRNLETFASHFSYSSFAKKLSKFSVFQTLFFCRKQKVCYIFSFSSPFAKMNSIRTNRLNSFCVSLLPFPKE